MRLNAYTHISAEYILIYNTFGSLESCFSRTLYTIAFLPLLLYLLWIIYNNMYSAHIRRAWFQGLTKRSSSWQQIVASQATAYFSKLFMISGRALVMSLLMLLLYAPFCQFLTPIQMFLRHAYMKIYLLALKLQHFFSISKLMCLAQTNTLICYIYMFAQIKADEKVTDENDFCF